MTHVVKNGGIHDAHKERTGQSRANPLDVAWLAGIVDGEGCLQIQPNRDRNGFMHIRVCVKIANTSRKMMDKVSRIIEEIAFKRYQLSETINTKGKQSKFFNVNITKQSAVLAVLEAILPHLTVKEEQAAVVIEYCRSRKAHRHTNDGFTEFEMAADNILKHLKREVFEYVTEGGVERKHDAPLLVGEAMPRSSQECELPS